MKRQPKVSIILPTYNQEKFIGNAIKSALLQGYDNVEILVRDDSSTDSTYVVAQELAQNYPTKVFVKRNSKNLGITANCNKLLDDVTGEFLICSAGDDEIVSGRIQAQLEFFCSHTDAILCNSAVEIREHSSQGYLGTYIDKDFTRSNFSIGKIIRQPNQANGARFMINWTKANHLRYDTRTPVVSDWLFWNELLYYGTVGTIQKSGLIYTRNEQSVTSAGIEKTYLADRLIATDIYLDKYMTHYYSLRIQRSHIFYFAAKRYAFAKSYKTSLKLTLFSISEHPFYFSKAWVLLIVIPIIFFGFREHHWTKMKKIKNSIKKR